MKVFVIVCIVIIALLALYLFVGYKSFALIIKRKKKTKKSKKPNYLTDPESFNLRKAGFEEGMQWLGAQPFEEVSVTSADGLLLKGSFFDRGVPDTVVCVHGYKSSGEKEFAGVSRFLMEQGVNLLLFDQRAHGRSQGKYIGFGALEIGDLLEWIALIKERKGPGCRIILYGISMGAATVINTASAHPDPAVRGVISDCGFTSAQKLFAKVIREEVHIPPAPILFCMNVWSELLAGYRFKDFQPCRAVKEIGVPVLFIHGDCDELVPLTMAEELYNQCPSDKRLLIVQGAKHAGSYCTDRAAYEQALKTLFAQVLHDDRP